VIGTSVISVNALFARRSCPAHNNSAQLNKGPS